MRDFGHLLNRTALRLALRQGWVFVSLGIFSAMGMAAAMDRYFETSDGLQLHYLEAGSGERTLLFVPGWLMPAAVFEAQLAGLSREFRVIAFDPRSQGLSQVSQGSHRPEIRLRDMDELLAATGVGDFILAGWSLGVLETLDFIEQRRPARLRGLILIDNSIGEGNPPPPRPSRRQENLADPQRRVPYLTGFCDSLFRRPLPPALRQAVLASALGVPPKAAMELIAQPYPRTYWRDIVNRQEVPVLYAVTPRLRDQAAALSRKRGPDLAEIKVYEDAGHALFFDAADDFNTLVRNFSLRVFSNLVP
ncbi:alpha/beta hydrolase [Candidatus Accumulibacter vicinus]|uniref:AB hydrolase superfamily protein YdjP n=1 Tax=Candidatus Accumulibacter vicinus TaxID=2954382 RepID=A0A084Y0S7_9PROT|nr:alpha/beta hydrolase [Candidatus Accumulibacter vicinus]KFB68321.1 MAG: AB hydrolase superfamily protein YdjP [Candidatus Accumulibacter vicinus]